MDSPGKLDGSGARKTHSVCPHTSQAVSRRQAFSWRAWLLSGAGVAALLWFLVRVLPKPSRAAYPCQRVAFPIASGFVLWMAALLGSAAAWRKAHTPRMALRRACLWLMAAGTGLAFVVGNLPFPGANADSAPSHLPLGEAKGILPGRVVWVHAPEATDWAGMGSGDRWYGAFHTDQSVVEEMLMKAVCSVAGQSNTTAAWDAIFRYFNRTHGRGDRGYQGGEKIAVKINLTACNARGEQVDPDTYDKKSAYVDWVDNSPQMTLALLRQLVYYAGVAQADIAVGDPTGMFPNYLYTYLRPEFSNVIYFDNYGGGSFGRTRTEFSTTRFDWSTPNADGKLQDYVPVPFAEATYFINFAILKGHGCGTTVCAKNNYGSLLRCPDGYLRGQGYLDYYNLHDTLPGSGGSTNLGAYRALVDLMGHPQLGGKTLFYLVDGLYGGYYWQGRPYKWMTTPFNNDWPSSLFASLDPVAIDSVCYDFLRNEWPDIVSGAAGANSPRGEGPQDYLHEAALADDPLSDTFYDPGRTGRRLPSLGVHEHWNNPIDKQYSRNLGTGAGIELVALTAHRPAPQLSIERQDNHVIVSWQASLTNCQLQSATRLGSSVDWTSVPPSPVRVQDRATVTNLVTGGDLFYRVLR